MGTPRVGTPTSMAATPVGDILQIGDIIHDTWRVVERIGEGTFSQIFLGKSIKTGERVAIKVEAPGPLKPVLEWESAILKSLQNLPFFCEYYYHGNFKGNVVLVMELLGESMSKIREGNVSGLGVPCKVCRGVALEMLDCIQAFHRLGYVHRDIKASNFVHCSSLKGNSRSGYCLIDFGLSRRHLQSGGEPYPARDKADFRGTSLYASLQAHYNKELGRKDDLWSWYFLIIDFLRGELPWAQDAQLKNRETVEKLKHYYTVTSPEELLNGVSGREQLLAINNYLNTLGYADKPDYAKIKELVRKIGRENNDPSKEGGEKKDIVELIEEEEKKWLGLTDLDIALAWCKLVDQVIVGDINLVHLTTLLNIAKKHETFMKVDCDDIDQVYKIQERVYRVEQRIEMAFKAPSSSIVSFGQKKEDENLKLAANLKKRRMSDQKIRSSIESQLKLARKEKEEARNHEPKMVDYDQKDVRIAELDADRKIDKEKKSIPAYEHIQQSIPKTSSPRKENIPLKKQESEEEGQITESPKQNGDSHSVIQPPESAALSVVVPNQLMGSGWSNDLESRPDSSESRSNSERNGGRWENNGVRHEQRHSRRNFSQSRDSDGIPRDNDRNGDRDRTYRENRGYSDNNRRDAKYFFHEKEVERDGRKYHREGQYRNQEGRVSDKTRDASGDSDRGGGRSSSSYRD